MRNKKYRTWGLALILLAIALLAFVSSLLVESSAEKILSIVCGAVILLGVLLMLPLYVEIKDDRIVTRFGVTSLHKEYKGSFKKHVFLFDDLRDLYIEDNKTVHLVFKGGESATFSISAFINKKQIIDVLYEARTQIRWFDQNE